MKLPLPFLVIAIPVLHSSGLWIATSSVAGGYVAGTLSATWVGTFILGNATLLSGLGLVSVAGVGAAVVGTGAGAAASGGLAATAMAAEVGVAAVATGAGPAATVLGMTPLGWGIAAGGTVLASTLGVYLTRKVMKEINVKRLEGGLEPISAWEIIREVKDFEYGAKRDFLERCCVEFPNFFLVDDATRLVVGDKSYPVKALQFRRLEDGSEAIGIGRRKFVVLLHLQPRETPDAGSGVFA